MSLLALAWRSLADLAAAMAFGLLATDLLRDFPRDLAEVLARFGLCLAFPAANLLFDFIFLFFFEDDIAFLKLNYYENI
jgi:hypothetical protein